MREDPNKIGFLIWWVLKVCLDEFPKWWVLKVGFVLLKWWVLKVCLAECPKWWDP